MSCFYSKSSKLSKCKHWKHFRKKSSVSEVMYSVFPQDMKPRLEETDSYVCFVADTP